MMTNATDDIADLLSRPVVARALAWALVDPRSPLARRGRAGMDQGDRGTDPNSAADSCPTTSQCQPETSFEAA